MPTEEGLKKHKLFFSIGKLVITPLAEKRREKESTWERRREGLLWFFEWLIMLGFGDGGKEERKRGGGQDRESKRGDEESKRETKILKEFYDLIKCLLLRRSSISGRGSCGKEIYSSTGEEESKRIIFPGPPHRTGGGLPQSRTRSESEGRNRRRQFTFHMFSISLFFLYS